MKTVRVIPGPTGPTGTFQGVRILSAFTGPTGTFAQWMQPADPTANGIFETVYPAGAGAFKTVIIAGYAGPTAFVIYRDPVTGEQRPVTYTDPATGAVRPVIASLTQ